MKLWRILLLSVQVSLLAIVWLSCSHKVQCDHQGRSEYTNMAWVEIVMITGSNQVSTGELIREMLRTNGVRCVVEGSLEHAVRVPGGDASKAVFILKQSRLLGQGVEIREGSKEVTH
jgi:hypothetical protein